MGQLVLLRNSERATWRRCRLKWKWSYDSKLAPERDKGALVFGRLAHKALEVYYPPGRKRGPHPAKTFAKLYRAGDYDFSQWDEEEQRYDALELGVSMMEGYVEQYGADDTIEIIAPEQSIQIDVFNAKGQYVCTWVGQVDAVYVDLPRSSRSHKVIGTLEHKSAKSIEEELRINSGYGEQGISYLWAADMWLHHHGHLPEGQHIDHVRMNWLRKAMPDTRPTNEAGLRLNKPTKGVLLAYANSIGIAATTAMKVDDITALLDRRKVKWQKLGEPSARQPRPLYHRAKLDVKQQNLTELNRRIRMEAWEIAQLRAGKLPLYKNPTKDCKWDCPFVEACELHEMGHDYEDMLRLEFTSWDPYEAHELELEKINA